MIEFFKFTYNSINIYNIYIYIKIHNAISDLICKVVLLRFFVNKPLILGMEICKHPHLTLDG